MPSGFKGFIHPVHCKKCLVESRSEYDVLSKSQLEEIASRVEELGRTRVFVETYGELVAKLGVDPLSDEKRKLNKEIAEITPHDLFKSKGFREILPILATANAVDWGMVGYEYNIDDILSGWEDTVILDMPEMDLGRIVIILDNAGEAVLDLLAGERLHELGYEVVLLARSLPYETDIILSEAEWLAGYLGVDLPILGTGSRYPATFINEMPDNIKGLIEVSDLVLAKGIANLEAAMESIPDDMKGKFYHLLRAKCIPMMELFGVPQSTPIVTSLRRALLYLEDYRSPRKN
ncbi:MAG: ARMT1-like domain-containing protein [Desulfurococcales archaeon]|nr:ARMT1-like domain-containing protein [Desulfurococcales archaeon]